MSVQVGFSATRAKIATAPSFCVFRSSEACSQLSGWRFHYASEVEAPAEIPPDIAAFQSQQGRWARGSVQVLRKLGGPIVASREPSRVKLEALAHLTGNIAYPGVVAIALLLPVVAGSRTHGAHWLHLVAFVLCTCSVFLFYERSQRALGRPFAKRVIDTVAAVVLGIGMARHAVVLVMDADLQHEPESVPAVAAPVLDGAADFSVGSRHVGGGEVDGSWPLARLDVSGGL